MNALRSSGRSSGTLAKAAPIHRQAMRAAKCSIVFPSTKATVSPAPTPFSRSMEPMAFTMPAKVP